MSARRARIVETLFEALRTPRVISYLERRGRILDVVVAGLSVPAQARALLRGHGASLARALGLATIDDLREVEAAVGRARASYGEATKRKATAP